MGMSKADPSELMTLIEDLEERESKLSEWERNFISSARSQLVNKNGLSDKQTDILNNLWERVIG